MGDTYDRIKDISARSRIFEKTSLVLEHEEGVKKSALTGLEASAFASWIYIITTSGHKGEHFEGDWEGKIKKITKQIKTNHTENQELIGTIKERINSQIEGVKKELNNVRLNLETELVSKIEALGTQQQRQQEDLKEQLNYVTQTLTEQQDARK
eukprot:CAMPEP_0115037804 /NCGR_PEP_ID=MMETSP0216-20121206/43032_1 /TAXON_ID=223996 /ORGANISM="Protocruzia adherens, Strain Boccale" /LENGTH=153 /DNA_ID=CAMNT_0002418085 /DNA_START=167 /DNA_END=628 /DNA_ORIENTATION=-